MAGMTLTEKILARESGRDKVAPGELVWAKVCSVLLIDMIGKSAFDMFDSLGVTEVFDKDRIICSTDHLAPAPTPQMATLGNKFADAVRSHGINPKHFYDLGRGGIGHHLMIEQGHVTPGRVAIGTDSHGNTYGAAGAVGNAMSVSDAAVAMAIGKCWYRVPESVKFVFHGDLQPWVMGKDISLHIMGMMHWNGHLIYKALEYAGPAVSKLDMAARMSISNMTVDLGAKNGIFPIDDVTDRYMQNRCLEPYERISSDEDAVYDQVYEIDVTKIEPMVSVPHRLDNVRPVGEVKGTKVNKAFIGTCTNGRLEDIAVAAEILKNKHVSRDVNFMIVPASQTVFLDAVKAGYVETLLNAGVSFETSSCASCAGIHTGVTGDGDIVISAGNRNMQGRMGSKNAEIYLASPAVVAASALKGQITDPRDL